MADTGTSMSSSKKTNSVKLKYTNFIPTDTQKGAKKGEDEISLQEAFRTYRKAKQKQLKQARRLRRRNLLRKADPKIMAALRRKFIQQAKKYFGYPYAKKYWPPDSQEYHSKLFLDCCGLVRQVMRDLADDFGFMIGPWNQAYMYDTLPITVQNEKDMRPGDLVFISATYYNPKSKKQPHNMTHVEIWLGDGPKTIGARWNNGKVQVFDSYRFNAMSYYDETYHFKSIDTWLKGVCKSYCKQHKWKKRKFNPHKKSVFSIDRQLSTDQQNGQQDDPADDDEDDITNFIMRGNSFYSETNPAKKKKTSQKKDKDNKKSSSASSANGASSSPITDAATPDIPDDLDDLDIPEDSDELLADDVDIDVAEEDSDAESDLESSSQDNEEDEMEFIDAGDADDDYAVEDVDTSKDIEENNDVDVRDSASRTGKLVDLDNRGIYLRDILGNEDAKSPATVTDIDTPKSDEVIQEMDKGHGDTKEDVEKINENNSSISDGTNQDNALAEDIQSLSITDSSVEGLNSSDEASKSLHAIPNNNQNALPKSDEKNDSQTCHSPMNSSRQSPETSTDLNDEQTEVVQSEGSDDSIAGSQSTLTVQGTEQGAC